MRTRTRLRSVSAAVVAATSGGLITATATPASAAVTCTSPTWKAQFYANTSFGGTPKLTACDSAISENYGTGDPAGVALPRDNFSVRWTVTRDFGSGGPFTLAAEAQDGIRVYLDGVRKIDLWKNVSSTQKRSVNVTIPAGKHTLRVDFVAWTGAANVKFTYAPRTSATVDKVKPLAPTGVAARLDNDTATAVVSWSRNKEMDLAGYRLYRREEGSSTWQHVATTTGATASSLPPVPGRTYFYSVRAHDKAGNVSAGSADQQVVTIAVTAPTGLAAQGLDEGVKLTWNALPGAVHYSVTRYRNGTPVLVKSAPGTSFTDTTAPRSMESYYWVKAVDGAGRASEPAVVRAIRPVAAPHDVTATPDAARVVLTWKINPDQDGDYYAFNVYRSKSLPVDTSTEPVRCTATSTSLADGQRQYTCTDRATAANTTYHYVIKGFDNADRKSVASATATVTTLASDQDTTPPAAVSGLTAKATEYGISLGWNANTESDLKRYVVYRGTVHESDDGTAVCSGGEWDYLGPTTTHYVDATLPDGDEHCYWIDAVDTSNNSSFKRTGTAVARAVTELDLTPPVATPEGSPVDLTHSLGESGEVDLSWNTVQGAVGYRVYRWDRTAGQYVSLSGDALVNGTLYSDSTAATGTTHFYWVSAVLADGSESAPGADWAILLPPDA
ncbi:PA14 domain-containing protein [Streptomyces sp. NPDC006872]|uniref:PA14 domain-containing protein n=1 Tax=Streptomyces sp. NPDC006872 TaxID=3155720 RepID=UPI00340CE63C